jgi:dipeptidyl aminopeptidase/acylaminoacyl peptidase
MAADRLSVALVLLSLVTAASAAAAAGGEAAEHGQPFTVQDLVRLDRVSEPAASPDGKHVAYTLRTTEMEANKARTGVWLADTRKRTASPLRLTDIAANSNAAEWSADGRFIYFLSNRSGSVQVWRVAAGGLGTRAAEHSVDAPGADALQVTNLPLDVGSFRVSPKGDRIVVSVDVYLDCPDLACTKQRVDAAAHSNATGVLYSQLFVRHWDAWSDGRRSQLYAMPLDDVARGAPVNLTGGIGDVPSKPFGGREDYAFSPDGTHVAFSVRAAAGEAWSTNFDIYEVAAAGGTSRNLTADNPAWDGQPPIRPTARSSPTSPWNGQASKPIVFIWCCSI